MFHRTTTLIRSGRIQCDDSCFSFGYGVNPRRPANLQAVAEFFGPSFVAEWFNGMGHRTLFVESQALREIDRDAGRRAIIQLLKNDFQMFSARPVETSAIEEIVSVFFEEMGDCRIFSNTYIHPVDHGADCLGSWNPTTRSSRDTFVCAVNDERMGYWVYSDDE